MDYQGGKKHGELLDRLKKKYQGENEDLLTKDHFKEIEDVEKKLDDCVDQFIKFDDDRDGVIGVMDLKKALEDMGQAKTHKEVMKMIREVDKENKDAINYLEFVDMVLGTRTTVLKLILMFEAKAKQEKETPEGPPPKKSITDLP